VTFQSNGSYTMRQSKALFSVLLVCATVSCGTLANVGSSDLAPQRLNMGGTYDWVDAYGNNTACLVHIFWQDEAWRGWVRTTHETAERCPWDGYELPIMRMRGDRVRMAIACPRSGCPTNAGRSTAYLLDVVPGVMLTGRAISADVGARWYNIRLVRRSEF